MTDPTSPTAIARADERRPAGIQDDSLVDHILDILTDELTVHYDALSGRYWMDHHDVHRLVTLAAQETKARAAIDVMVKGTPEARGKKTFVHGLYEAAEIVKEVRL